MPRPSQLLHPDKPVAPLRMAATVLLLRQSPQGMEVLLTRRSSQAGFAAGLYVFPGGAVDAADTAAAATLPHAADTTAWALAAIRETFEEVGVLLARHIRTGQIARAADVDALHACIGRRASAQQFYQALAALELEADPGRLHLLGRWVAPLDIAKRFDTPFFVAPLPDGQIPRPDAHEQTEVRWLSPAQALQLHAQQQFPALFPTIRTLEKIQGYQDTEHFIQAVQQNTPWYYQPRGAIRAGQEVRLTPEDAGYGEVGLVTPGGQVAHVLDWQSAQPVPLLRHIQRLTAPNASVMTGPGTNSYLIGSPASGYIVIDPGPALPAHIQRLLEATQGHIRYIVCTHSHPDHSPGAVLLQQLCEQQHGPQRRPIIAGMPHGPHARPDAHFQPDQPLQDGDTLLLHTPACDGPDATAQFHTLLALHTPGHTANHLCLLLVEDGLLFSGDHILGGSTTVIDPPDGHMGQYLASLDRLMRACQHYHITHILPAHGHVLEQPDAVLARLKQHRLDREAQVRAAMQQCPQGSLDDWLTLAYADTPTQLWPIARRSLLAHVQHLQQQGSPG